MKRVRLISLIGAVALLMLAGSAHAKVDICHNNGNGGTETLRVAKSAVSAHEAHGDSVGACEELVPVPAEVVMLRCLADSLATPITVSSLSATAGAPAINADPTYGQGESCAEAIASLLDDGFKLQQVLGDNAGGLETFYLLDR